MESYTTIPKWFWVAFIVCTLLNAVIFRYRARKHIRLDPELAEGYTTLIRGFVIWGNLPWLVMGIGCVLGGVPSVFHYFRPLDGNLFVLAFFASVFLVWILGTFWLFFRGGAEMLAKHPGLFNFEIKSPHILKVFWILCLAGGVFGLIMLLTQDISAGPL